MADSSSVDYFARRLVENVRDRAIDSCDQLARGTVGGVLGNRWRGQLESPGARDAMLELLPDVVDQVLFHLLDAIDNGHLPLAIGRSGAFEDLAESGLGEMGGLYMAGEGGWIEEYSSERHFDPVAGLGDIR